MPRKCKKRSRTGRLPYGSIKKRYYASELSALLNKSDFVHLTINREAQLTLFVHDLNTILSDGRHGSRQHPHDLTLGIIRLTGASLGLLGFGGFFNLRLILVTLLRQERGDCHRIADLVAASRPEDLCGDNNNLRVAVLVGEAILDVSRIH